MAEPLGGFVFCDYKFLVFYRYADGGHKSGFNHVEHTFKQRLLHVKGKHHVRVSEVKKITQP